MPSERRTEAGATAEGAPSPRSYAGLGLALSGAGCAAASWGWGIGASAWAGSLLAWSVQTATFWPLWGRIRAGERALRVWIAGIAARAAGLGAAAAGAWAAGLAVDSAAAAYGVTIMVLLWAEGFWLGRATRAESGEGTLGSRPATEPIDS